MQLCMFHPLDRPMERGWVGRVDGDRVTHLAAQTLQSFFMGGGGAREHAEYPLADVGFLAPVLHPPTVRLFESQDEFAFANTTAIAGPGAEICADGALMALPRVAAVIGDEQRVGGFTALVEWRAPERAAPKDRDFALVLGPTVVTPDELVPTELEAVVRSGEDAALRTALAAFDWDGALALAAEGTALRPGDVVAGPAAATVEAGATQVEVELGPIGTLGSGPTCD